MTLQLFTLFFSLVLFLAARWLASRYLRRLDGRHPSNWLPFSHPLSGHYRAFFHRPDNGERETFPR